MFSSHYEGLGPSLFTPKLASGTHCAPGMLFFTLLAPLLAPKWDPRAPQGSPKEPKGAQKPPQGHLKSITNSTWHPTWAPKGGQEAPGVPPGGKMPPTSTKKTKKNRISSCFLNIFGETIGGTVQKKGERCVLFLAHFWCDHRRHSPTLEKTLRRARFFAYGILWRSPCHPAAAEGAKLSKMLLNCIISVAEH
jgi:hypothetical protein